MSDFKDRFSKWQNEAKQRFDEIDKQLGLSDTVGEGVKKVSETAQKGADKIKTEAEKTEFGKQAVSAAEETFKTAENAAKKAWQAGEPIRDAAEDAGEFAGEVVKEAGKTASEVIGSAGKKAGEVFDDVADSVGRNAKRVSNVYSFGADWSRTFDSAYKTFSNAAGWVQENPLKAAGTGVSMAVGAGLGVIFTGISTHWLFSSALPVWSLGKIAEQFNDYLRGQEEMLANGELSKAAAERVEFERDIARQFGAPLLGAFSFASGAVLLSNVLNPRVVTGAPVEWLLGRNPMLESIWFFGNGLVCFRTGYEFFMISLEGHKDVEKMVTEIKGLLPDAIKAA